MLQRNFLTSLLFLSLLMIFSCVEHKTVAPVKTFDSSFAEFAGGFPLLQTPIFLGNNQFLKQNISNVGMFRPIEDKDLHEFLGMDSLPKDHIYYFGRLPDVDSVYYLVTYFAIRDSFPSEWWTLTKIGYNGKRISDTNLAFNVLDRNFETTQRFCKISGYRSERVDITGKYDLKKKMITDTVLTSRVVDLLLPQPE